MAKGSSGIHKPIDCKEFGRWRESSRENCALVCVTGAVAAKQHPCDTNRTLTEPAQLFQKPGIYLYEIQDEIRVYKQTLAELRMRDTANCWAGLAASSALHGLSTVVDSMRESIHAVRCDFLSLMHIGLFACFHDISLECSRFMKIALLFFRLV